MKRNDPIMELAYPRTQQVAGRAQGLIAGLVSGAGKKHDPATITEQQLAEVCRALDPNAKAPLIVGTDFQNGHTYANWMAYLHHWRQQSSKLTAEVMVFAGVLEPEHLALMAAMEQCAYFKQLDLMRGIPLRNTDLSFIAPDIWKYVLLARRLEEYAARVLARRANDL